MLDIDHRFNSIGQTAFEELCLLLAYHDLQFSEQIEDTTDFFIELSRRARHSSSEHPIIGILLHERFHPQERKDSTGHRVYMYIQSAEIRGGIGDQTKTSHENNPEDRRSVSLSSASRRSGTLSTRFRLSSLVGSILTLNRILRMACGNVH